MTLPVGQYASLDAARAELLPVQFMALFDEFRAPSWDRWRTALSDLTPAVRSFYVVGGRGVGKSRICSLLGACAGCRTYRRAPGEWVYVAVFGPDRKQSAITFGYIRGLLHSVPELRALIVAETKSSITLSTGVIIEVLSATRAAPRGRSYALVIIEEAAFLPQDNSANPDVELLRACRPALARCPGSLLAVVSSPYAKRGILWEAVEKYGDNARPDTKVLHAPTLDFNPTFDAATVEQALKDDPEAARAEYLAEFRSDIESYISLEVVRDCIEPGVSERPTVAHHSYRAFCDPAGGSGQDSFALAIGHTERDGGEVYHVLDCLREVRPPFSPERVCQDFASELKRYGCRAVTGDRFGGEFPREAFRRHGIAYEVADRAKSELLRDALSLLNSRSIELLDHDRLIQQITSLERRRGRGGRDVIDHSPNASAHDDAANAALGLMATLAAEKQCAIKGATW